MAGRSDRAGGGRPPRLRLHPLAVAVGMVLLVVTAALTLAARGIVANQEHRLLVERGNEVNLVLSQSIDSTVATLRLLGRDADRGGADGFARAAAAAVVGPANAGVGLELVVIGPGGATVSASAGVAPPSGTQLTGPAAAAATAASTGHAVTSSGVFRVGGARALALAVRTQGGSVVLRQTVLGPVSPPRQAGTAPFSELRVVLYASAHPDPAQVVVATSPERVSDPSSLYVPLHDGAITWLTGVSALSPLVGSVAAAAPWVTLGVGLLVALAVAALLEVVARRRDAAEAALEREHRFAETLQRRLLPAIPEIDGLDIASVYVTGSDAQAVGGDWFDVFALPSGAIGLVIGDVMGHDVEAAALMAQLRSVLRGHAHDGADPAAVLDRLGEYLEVYSVPAIVTAVYGVLAPPCSAGTRTLRWANAGHPPPLVRRPDGSVDELAGAESPLLGAPVTGARPSAECSLEPGASLLLYTDGLVEVPGGSLDEAIAALRRVVGPAGAGGAAGLCATVLAAEGPLQRRDDVALLAVRLDAPA